MIRVLCAWGLLLWAAGSWSQEIEVREGVHYAKLPVAVATRDPSKVEVVEVFSYACPHCRDFDPELEAWRERQSEAVDFHRVPAVFNATYATLAQAFYTAEALGVADAVHQPIFHAIHSLGVDLRRTELLAALFEETAGVAPADFNQMFSSFAVRGRVQQADARARAYRVRGVPVLIVDGAYRIDARMAGSYQGMLAITDHLVAQVAQTKGLDVTPAAAEEPVAEEL